MEPTIIVFETLVFVRSTRYNGRPAFFESYISNITDTKKYNKQLSFLKILFLCFQSDITIEHWHLLDPIFPNITDTKKCTDTK